MAWTLDLLKRLNEHGVRYVLIGAVAGIAHGLSRQTRDIDVCAPLDDENLSRILAALRDIRPRHRMRPDLPEIPSDPAQLRGFKNLYLLTDLGAIDFLGELQGAGTFDDLAGHTIALTLNGVQCQVLDLDTLIRSKRATNRRKDQYDLAELQAIRKRLDDVQESPPT